MINIIIIVFIGVVATCMIYLYLNNRYGEFKWYIRIDDKDTYCINKDHIEVTVEEVSISLIYKNDRWTYAIESDDYKTLELGQIIELSNKHTFVLNRNNKKNKSAEAIIGALVIVIISLIFVLITIGESHNDYLDKNQQDSNIYEGNKNENLQFESQKEDLDISTQNSIADSLDNTDNSRLGSNSDRELGIKQHTIAAAIRCTVGVTYDNFVVIGSTDVPYVFDISNWNNIKSVSCVGEVLVGLTYDNTVVLAHTASYKYSDDVSDWTDIIQISAGNMFAIGLDRNGKVYGIGRNEEGQLNFDDWCDIRQIATGHRFSVGMNGRGELFFTGQYADKYREQYEANRDAWNDILTIFASGGYNANEMGHVVGLKRDGTIVCLGDEFPNKAAGTVDDVQDVRLLAVGDYHLVAVTNSDEMIIIGDAGTVESYEGQNIKERPDNWPVKEFVDLVAGRELTVGLTSDGEVYAMGAERQGQLEANNWGNIKCY